MAPKAPCADIWAPAELIYFTATVSSILSIISREGNLVVILAVMSAGLCRHLALGICVTNDHIFDDFCTHWRNSDPWNLDIHVLKFINVKGKYKKSKEEPSLKRLEGKVVGVFLTILVLFSICYIPVIVMIYML